MFEYSFILPLYHKEHLNSLRDSIDSMINQTIPPKEILIIIDNISNPSHINLIKEYKEKKIKILIYRGKGGLGGVLAKGVISSKTEIILRQDSDDISIKNRASKQIKCFINTNADIVCSNIREFMHVPGDLIKNLKKSNINKNNYFIRNPINHMSVAFKRSSIIKYGNYKPLKNFEDWYLWLRAINLKCKIEIINETLVYARLGNKFYNKRHGLKYYFTELCAMYFFSKKGLIPLKYFFLNIIIRFFVRLSPLVFTNFFYKHLREK